MENKSSSRSRFGALRKDFGEGLLLITLVASFFWVVVKTTHSAPTIGVKGTSEDRPVPKTENGIDSLIQLKPGRSTRELVESPPAAICFPVTVKSVHDGDTCTVNVSFDLVVRYNRCWAPELRDPLGPASRDSAKQAEGKAGKLYVDLVNIRNLADLFTFGRVIGEIWVDGSTESESQRQVGLKMASTTKKGELGK